MPYVYDTDLIPMHVDLITGRVGALFNEHDDDAEVQERLRLAELLNSVSLDSSFLDPWNPTHLRLVREHPAHARMIRPWHGTNNVLRSLLVFASDEQLSKITCVTYPIRHSSEWPWRNMHHSYHAVQCGDTVVSPDVECQGPRGHEGNHAARAGVVRHIEWENTAPPDDAVFTCALCEYVVSESISHHRMFNDQQVCEPCGTWLTPCNGNGISGTHLVMPSDARWTTYGYSLCNSCRSERDMQACDDCGDDFDADDTWGDLCSGCEEYEQNRRAEEEMDQSEYLMGYSHKPPPVFYGNGKVYFGWELETEVSQGFSIDTVAESIHDMVGSVVYLKEDSSIHRGFELVTHPMTHDYARNEFPWKLLNSMSALGCYTQPSNNGMHVHVNRDGFDSPVHIYKWMKLLYRNHRAVNIVARRVSSEWAAWEEWDRQNIKHYAKGERTGERYSAINVGNRHTFEVRVFAASLTPHEVMGCIDLVAASVEYTRTLTSHEVINHAGWGWGSFLAWVKDQGDTYAGLIKMTEAEIY